MRLIPETNFNFMRWKWVWIGVSSALNVLSIILFFTMGVKQGVEFTGGAEVTLRFVEAPALDQVRSKLLDAGLPGVSVTTFGDTGGKELSIRVGLPENKAPQQERDLARQVIDVLHPAEIRSKLNAGQLDLNIADQVTIANALQGKGGVAQPAAEATAAALTEWRRQHGGIVGSVQDALAVPGVDAGAKAWISGNAFAGPFGLRGQNIIEGSVSQELRGRAFQATLWAMVGMLLYIWIRYRFQWGLGAIVALVHDVVFTLGMFIVFRFEADLPVVAAFLTLVGYSVNDTIVVYDRIRENLRNRGGANFESVINDSINQTLSRTLITSFTAWLCVLMLFLFAGPVLRSFSFVMLIGIIIGTYSSIYIASPTLVIWLKLFPKISGVVGAPDPARKGDGRGAPARPAAKKA